jgi:polyhydroxybutyrate depolymerase
MQVPSQGATYPVLVHVPDGYRPGRRLPMVLNLHGATQSGSQSLSDSQLDRTADTYDFVLVSPDGGIPNLAVPASLPAGYFWNVPGVSMPGGLPVPPGSRDDERFLLDVVASIGRRLCVNKRRIYVEGASNGAMMTSYLACHHADLFAAAGAVSGVRAGRADPDDPQQIDRGACRPARPMPVIAIHGRKDPLVPYGGNDSAGWGYDVLTAMRRWGRLNDCRRAGADRRITPTVTRMRWKRCAAEVVLVSSDIGGHTWYGHKSVVPYELAVGETDMSIDNNELLWGFFRDKRLPR